MALKSWYIGLRGYKTQRRCQNFLKFLPKLCYIIMTNKLKYQWLKGLCYENRALQTQWSHFETVTLVKNWDICSFEYFFKRKLEGNIFKPCCQTIQHVFKFFQLNWHEAASLNMSASAQTSRGDRILPKCLSETNGLVQPASFARGVAQLFFFQCRRDRPCKINRG